MAALVITLSAAADEGMWLLPLIQQMNKKDLREAGCKLTPQEIYNINKSSLKDAIVQFGGGCTGEMISNQGLLVTNHHCGYGSIQGLSTDEHNYLMDGYWANERAEEIPVPGLSVTFLVSMKDVTDVMEPAEDKAAARNQILEAARKDNPGCRAVVTGFYNDNVYYLIIYRTYTDVRFVGAPPASMGKFGGETDNWMWPRHTGDFSMFRVYVDGDNRPAAYSKDNIPYRPLKHMEISLKGVDEGDFTFVFGYPGTTRRYVTHDYVDLAANVENPVRIALRDIRLSHYNDAMQRSAAQRLKYASRVASIANGWKKWQGESLGIERLHGVEQKVEQERQFERWAADKPQYASVLLDLEDNYARLREVELEWVYFTEAAMASDFMQRAYRLYRMRNLNGEQLEAAAAKFLADSRTYFEDFDQHSPVDKAIFTECYIYMWEHGYAPYFNKRCNTAEEVYNLLDRHYDNNVLNNPKKLEKLLSLPAEKLHKKLLEELPAKDLELINLAYTFSYNADKRKQYNEAEANINRLMRVYVKGMMEQYPDSNFFPDANLTLRVAYGHVEGFKPKDATYYTAYTTLDGIMEKENPDIYDYRVEPRLKELWQKKDYGPYAKWERDRSGAIVPIMPVSFIATNHTTGGNSGSPVLNADGQLVGINYDRCWEGTMSDLLFDPAYCRNISLDIRYCLFIIDKYAGAHHLIEEMTIVTN